MRKIILVLLLLSIMFSLCACGDNKTTTSPTETTQPTEPDVIVTEPPSITIDTTESTYYKNNNWPNGIFASEIAGISCASTGDEWPSLETGDLFIDDMFMYGYNMRFDGEKWIQDETMNGWGVHVVEKDALTKATVYHVKEQINYADVVNAAYLMSDITLGKYARTLYIPETVTDISGLLFNTKMSINLTIRMASIPEKYDSAFDVAPDVKRKIEDAVVYDCSKTITLDILGDFNAILEIAGSAKYSNIVFFTGGFEEDVPQENT